MYVQLSEESRRYLAEQVAAGYYPSEEAALEEAVCRMRREEPQPKGRPAPGATPNALGSIGAMREDAELLGEIIETAMRNRREQPWRLPAGE